MDEVLSRRCVFTFILIALFAGHTAAGETILYQRQDNILRDSKWGRLAELQAGLNAVLASCGADAIPADGRFGAKSFAALAAAAECKHWPAAPARAITLSQWRAVFPGSDAAGAAHTAPSVEDRAFALTLAHEATDYDRLVWNYGTADHAGATWGPFGATADFGNEIRGILARINEMEPELIDAAFGTETAFVRDTYLRSLGAHDGFNLLKIVFDDPARRDIWRQAFVRLAEDARARAAFLWYALESPRWLRPGLQIAYELIPRSEATEIDYAFLLDLITQTGGYRTKVDQSKIALADAFAKKGSALTPAERRQVIGQTFAGLVTPTWKADRTGRNVVFYIDDLPAEKISAEEMDAWRRRSHYRASDYGLIDARSFYPEGL